MLSNQQAKKIREWLKVNPKALGEIVWDFIKDHPTQELPQSTLNKHIFDKVREKLGIELITEGVGPSDCQNTKNVINKNISNRVKKAFEKMEQYIEFSQQYASSKIIFKMNLKNCTKDDFMAAFESLTIDSRPATSPAARLKIRVDQKDKFERITVDKNFFSDRILQKKEFSGAEVVRDMLIYIANQQNVVLIPFNDAKKYEEQNPDVKLIGLSDASRTLKKSMTDTIKKLKKEQFLKEDPIRMGILVVQKKAIQDNNNNNNQHSNEQIGAQADLGSSQSLISGPTRKRKRKQGQEQEVQEVQEVQEQTISVASQTSPPGPLNKDEFSDDPRVAKFG